MTAFAMNSVLCRLALGPRSIDAATFTSVRFTSGALFLGALVLSRRSRPKLRELGNLRSALALFGYGITFSYAYLSLAAGTGALILFGAVQITMIVSGLIAGERPSALEWIGLFAALIGLVYLVLPGIAAPSLSGAALMSAAGVGWGVYSMRGRGSKTPGLATTGNFLRVVPFVLAFNVVSAVRGVHVEPRGILYAVISGALTSGLGYVLWYAAIRHLTAARAAAVQLSVPVIAAVLGVLLLHEAATSRLVIAGVAILGGVALALSGRTRTPARGR